MPIWNEKLQKWGYLYYEEVSHITWLGISRDLEINMPITHDDLNNWFSYHSPKENQPERYEGIRNRAREFAEYFITASQPSADQTAALRKLRETVMAMNLTIACNE